MSGLKDEKLIQKQTDKKTETCKLYSRVFWILLPNIIKIDFYYSELHRFKVGAFFETQPVLLSRRPFIKLETKTETETLALVAVFT